MNIVAFIFIFFLIWWLVFYMALAIGVKTDDSPEKGHATSAPVHPHLGLKAAVTTVVALIITGTLFALTHYDLVDLSFITDPR